MLFDGWLLSRRLVAAFTFTYLIACVCGFGILLLSVFVWSILCVPDIYRRQNNLLRNITQLVCIIWSPLFNCACIVRLFDGISMIFFFFARTNFSSFLFCYIFCWFLIWYLFSMLIVHYQSHLRSSENHANSTVQFNSGTSRNL